MAETNCSEHTNGGVQQIWHCMISTKQLDTNVQYATEKQQAWLDMEENLSRTGQMLFWLQSDKIQLPKNSAQLD